jgi:hypothetical protein
MQLHALNLFCVRERFNGLKIDCVTLQNKKGRLCGLFFSVNLLLFSFIHFTTVIITLFMFCS